MYLPFDLRQLRFFLVVAEEENLGRAALRLNVSASPLSRRIRELEERIDLQLFHHVKKRLKLTPAGYAFSIEVRRFLSHAEELKRSISDISSGAYHPIHVGYVPGAMSSGLLPKAISNVKITERSAQFRLHPMRSREQIAAIHQGSIELALVHTPPASTENLEISLLEEDSFSLVVSKNSSIPNSFTIEDIYNQNWITLAEGYSPTFHQQFIDACQMLGFDPDIRHQVRDIPSVIGLIEGELGIGILQSKLARICPDSVKVIPFPNFPLAVKIYGIHRKSNPSPTVAKLLKFLNHPNSNLVTKRGE